MIHTTKEQDRQAIKDNQDLVAYITKCLHRAKHWYNQMTQERELAEAQEQLDEMLTEYEEKWGESFAR